ELGRLVEELATEPMPGVAVLTTRVSISRLSLRRDAPEGVLDGLAAPRARKLLQNPGGQGRGERVNSAGGTGGLATKAGEHVGTYLVRFQAAKAAKAANLPPPPAGDYSTEELHLTRVLQAFQQSLDEENQDILALATAFRTPPTEERLLQYLA